MQQRAPAWLLPDRELRAYRQLRHRLGHVGGWDEVERLVAEADTDRVHAPMNHVGHAALQPAAEPMDENSFHSEGGEGSEAEDSESEGEAERQQAAQYAAYCRRHRWRWGLRALRWAVLLAICGVLAAAWLSAPVVVPSSEPEPEADGTTRMHHAVLAVLRCVLPVACMRDARACPNSEHAMGREQRMHHECNQLRRWPLLFAKPTDEFTPIPELRALVRNQTYGCWLAPRLRCAYSSGAVAAMRRSGARLRSRRRFASWSTRMISQQHTTTPHWSTYGRQLPWQAPRCPRRATTACCRALTCEQPRRRLRARECAWRAWQRCGTGRSAPLLAAMCTVRL